MFRQIFGMLTGCLLLACSANAFAEEMSRGEVLYRAYCVICHGPEGKGDGLSAEALIPSPPDFSDPAFDSSFDRDALRAVILKGKEATQMEGFEGKIPPELANLVVEYILSF